ncbi:MAG: hypothetical protein KBD64_03060 [Gammaproteobacteria bacterium]|nr:hypothetical protein [Gammaproteobacteria bacterium]
MGIKNLLKAFMAGVTLPALFFPIAYIVLYTCNYAVRESHVIFMIPIYLPFFFGITNVIYYSSHRKCLINQYYTCLWFPGLILGLAVAVIGIFVLDIPSVLLGITSSYKYFLLLVVPIVYGLIFRFIIKWMNRLVDLP